MQVGSKPQTASPAHSLAARHGPLAVMRPVNTSAQASRPQETSQPQKTPKPTTSVNTAQDQPKGRTGLIVIIGVLIGLCIAVAALKMYAR